MLSQESNTTLSSRVWHFFSQTRVLLFIWIAIAVFTALKQYAIGSYNNYLIFKYTFIHAVEGLNLYSYYPNEYTDSNHYGPFFSLLIAPFAMLPDWIGMLLWQLSNTLFLFWAVSRLPISNKLSLYFWLITHEMLTSVLSFQINPSIAAIIIITYLYIDEEKDFGAAFFIMLGTFVKLYGIVGLSFFFF
jgi:hypothetical protein